MATGMSREELVLMVTKIMKADGTEEEVDELISALDRNVPHPAVTDLIFYSPELVTPEEIVDKALSYDPLRM